MKTMKFLLLLLTLPSLGRAAETAGYYRVWQGFKKSEFSSPVFQERLPAFMNATVAVYGSLLNNYLVVVPPSEKPAFIPDEFALVALRSEADYQRVRATPEGKAYGESHWELFARENSKSAPYVNYFPAEPNSLESNKAYDLVGAPVDWQAGHTTFFLGLRKGFLSRTAFLARLSQHVKLAANSFRSMGLKGFVLIAHEDYEAAYMNWESKEAMLAAFGTAAGANVQKDAAEIMDTLQWSEAEAFDSRSVVPGHFYQSRDLIPDDGKSCYENAIAGFCEENDCEDHVIYGLAQRQAIEECR